MPVPVQVAGPAPAPSGRRSWLRTVAARPEACGRARGARRPLDAMTAPIHRAHSATRAPPLPGQADAPTDATGAGGHPDLARGCPTHPTVYSNLGDCTVRTGATTGSRAGCGA